MTPSPSLERVARGQLCSGCGLCAGIAPGAVAMAMAPPGYLRPHQSAALTDAQEAGIAAACPALIVDESDLAPAPIDDPLWGRAHFVGTGFAHDDTLRHRASSGGVLSALLAHALATGMVDFVVQTGADPDSPTGNRTDVSADAGAILAAAGSRYAPSAPLADLEAWLARGRFAFVGKPCDVTALRARARTDPRIAAQVPLMLAFFCAGIPSAAGTGRILAKLGVEPHEVAAFRYRGDGWPGFATATLHDGSTRRMSYADSWGDILSKEVQFRCKICPDAVGNAADIACADAWYGDDRGYPSFAEQDGRSLVIARSMAGLALLDAARAASVISTEPLAMAEIIRMQPSQARRKRQILSRLAAMAVAGRPRPRYRGVQLRQAAVLESPLAQARSFAGLLRRFIQGRT
ncbi:Coenzyme F420 hydrogenase/dehydrogenase, beta subunit C-terminal domain [Sandarakinorhabdus sp. DWP1-3-1]|uniref:Coenzyme F420 hydrogenase/dehydrogenase, beta subunit C-terminal domain n=1 Tax=Sandarakinorhabdus sp. DWP1-3-1 TaxID=2804627 RepID=UPI003CF181D4